MEESVFDNLLSGARFAHEAKLKAEQEAEAERLRLIEEQRIEQERIRQENERLKAEAEAMEKELAIERKRVEEERKAAEAAAKAERDALEAARLAAERELQAKKDAEAKAERERMAEVERQRKEAEKLAKAPIKKQLTVWVDSFAIASPSISHPVSTEINNKFEAFKAWAKTQIENL
jgi:membrane protein involved in colicin uptake